MGYWYSKKENNVRRFFEEYAQSNGFDPLVPDNWYSVSRQSVLDTKVFIQSNNIIILTYYIE